MRSSSWLKLLPAVASQKHWFPSDNGFSEPWPLSPSSCSQPQPKTKLASAWQCARRTTACTSSASDQLHSLIFSSFCRTWTDQQCDTGRWEGCWQPLWMLLSALPSWSLADSPSQYLNVLLGDEPWPVCQDLVDLVEVAEFGGDEFEATQPLGVTPCP